jgi:hypothetical protein
MIYLMKQKLFSWGDDFTIKDDAGNDRFLVDGKAFSLGNQLSFQDMAGNELAFIRQKLLSWGRRMKFPKAISCLPWYTKSCLRSSNARSRSMSPARTTW